MYYAPYGLRIKNWRRLLVKFMHKCLNLCFIPYPLYSFPLFWHMMAWCSNSEDTRRAHLLCIFPSSHSRPMSSTLLGFSADHTWISHTWKIIVNVQTCHVIFLLAFPSRSFLALFSRCLLTKMSAKIWSPLLSAHALLSAFG